MKRLPSYRCWKTRDVGYVFHDGRKIYFPGKFNSPESRTAYANFLTALRVGLDVGRVEPTVLTVAGLCAHFLTWAQTYYRKHGRSTGSYERFATAVVPPLLERLHSKKVDDVGRADLRAVQDALIARGLARSTVNDRIRFAKQIFKWGVENDLVKPETFARIAALKGLVAGRSPAREPEPVSAVADAVVEKTAAFASQTVADLIFVLRRTGMRPGEAFRLRWRDVDRSGDVWLYYPSEWKTEHWRSARRRVVPLAAPVREVLERYAAKSPDAPIFSPRDAVRERYADQNGDVSEAVERRIERTAAEYNKNSFRRAVARAAERAGLQPWAPGRLRHSAATEIRAKAGLEAAQVVLGHASAKTTEIYAETALDAAVAAAERVWGVRDPFSK
ncbi:MAG: tyrosine-type recombinase/integrase [Thermoguttaceae bacterium]|nr:tyrosine-type recombinase/integrase [Thermoguttaceae bacterium]